MSDDPTIRHRLGLPPERHHTRRALLGALTLCFLIAECCMLIPLVAMWLAGD